MTEKLLVKGLYKIFGRRPERALELLGEGQSKAEIQAETGMIVGVQDASFTVNSGEVFVVMGLSGSGKSTLVRMLNRLIEPTAGEVLVDGRDIERMGRRELTEFRRNEISMVFQSFGLMPHLTVLQNAAYGLNVAGVPRAERDRRAMQALEAVGLKENAANYPEQLSGGMKQRVGLARALATNPAIMLMDEAFSALDPLIRAEMQDELLRLQAEQARTVVFISHDLDEAIRIGDRIAIMEEGRIIQIGTAQEILERPANDYVASFFRDVDVAQVYDAGHIAEAEAVPVLEAAATPPREALARLRGEARGAAVLVDGERRLRGVVTAESLARALESPGIERCEEACLRDSGALAGGTPLARVLERAADSPHPLPVVDADGRYLGAITRARLLRVLSRSAAAAEIEGPERAEDASGAEPEPGDRRAIAG